MKGKLTKLMMVAMMLVTVLGLTATALTVSTTTVAAATDKWSRMDLPTTLNYQMFPDSAIWDLTAAADGTLFALVEDTTSNGSGHLDVADGGKMKWDGLRWAVYPAYSDIAVFKSTDGGYDWSLMWHVPSSETGAPIAVVPQPGYVDATSGKDAVFLAMGTRYLTSNNSSPLAINPGNYAGNLSEGNIYRSMNGGASFMRANPRCPAVTLTPFGPNTGGTITSMDVVENIGYPGTYMAIVGVSSLGQSKGTGTGSCGEGVWTWNRQNDQDWSDLQISNAVIAPYGPPKPGTMPAGNCLDVIQVMGSRTYTTDGVIVAVANDIIATDPALEATGIYVCFYDANDGIWGGDIDSPTTATRTSWAGDYAGAACMATGTDFNNVTGCYVFVGLAGCKGTLTNNDVWRVRGLATVTGPSAITTCNSAGLLYISDIAIPAEASTAVYVGCDFPAGQAQVFCISNGITWPTPIPSFKPPSGCWPVFVTNMAGTMMAAGGGDGGDYYTTSAVSKMYATSRGTAFNGVGLMDDIAVSEDIPGFLGSDAAANGDKPISSWCLAEAVSEEVSPLYATDGLIYVTTFSDWGGLSLWRLTNGKWERVMYEDIRLPDGFKFDGKDTDTTIDQYTFWGEQVWTPRVVPQFSTDKSMFLLGGRSDWAHTDYRELIWYSPDAGNDWKAMPQMPIGAEGWGGGTAGSGLSETGWYVQDSNILFVGDINGWIYKTTNRGASWTDGALTGVGLEITSIRTSPIYSETGAAGTDKCLLVGTYDSGIKGTIISGGNASHECEVWLSQDGAIKDLENVGDPIYVSPSWTAISEDDLGGTVVNFDKNWATNHIIYAASQGWLDEWFLTGLGEANMQRTQYTDVSVVRTAVDFADPSAATWQTLYGADDWNNAAPKPMPIAVVGLTGTQIVYRLVVPSALEIGPDGTVYVAFSLADSSYNHDWLGSKLGDLPTPQDPGYGRFTLGGILRCLDGTLKTPEWEIMHNGLGPWDGLLFNRAVPGNTHLISLTFDWKEWRFKLAFWEDTLSGAGPTPVSPLANAQGVGALVSDTSVNVPLSWQAKGGASQYQWQISEDSAFTPANTKSGTTSDLTVTVLDLKPATTYFWRSRALEPMLCRWNTAQQFTTVIGGDTGAAKLITPEIGSTITDSTPLFTWSGIASVTNYQIQVATSPTFAAADIVIDKTLGNVMAYEADKELVNGTYYWQVKGTNAATATETPWSALGSFTLDTSAGGAGTPVWVWVLIVLGVLLGIIVLVLILRTRRPV